MISSVDTITYQLKLLNKITQVPLSILNDEGIIIESFPFEECGVPFSLSSSAVPSIIKAATEIPFFNIDNQSIIYSLIPVDGKENFNIFVGPAKLSRTIDPVVYHKNSDLFREIPFENIKAILPMLPLVNYYDFFYLLQLLYYQLNDIKFSTEKFLMDKLDLNINKNASQILFSRRETSVYHHSYIGELLMCDVIRNGQVDRLAEAARFSEKGVPGVIHPDPLRNAKDYGIITITILTRPAIQGGLNDEIAYAMSDAYMREIEASNDFKEIFNICFRAGSEYTHAVAKIKKSSNFSSYVIRCLDYLQNHLHEKIVLSDVSNHLQINVKQLSALFKKETGLSITDYIHRERVSEAKNLLAHTDLSFSDISNCLNFCNQSYFNKIFKKITDSTPSQYREEHYKTPIIDANYSIADYMKEVTQRKNPPIDYSSPDKQTTH